MSSEGMGVALETPVLVIGFNRPDAVRQVLAQVRLVRPTKLYFAVDGARPDRLNEAALVQSVRSIREEVDWPCEVFSKFSDSNQGCRVGVSSAIDWFFGLVEEGIILEDDCVPDPSFFTFCHELLGRYRNDDRVGHIGGFNVQDGHQRGRHSYYFSRCFHVWGWATWRRAWKDYDIKVASLPQFEAEDAMARVFQNVVVQRFWAGKFRQVYQNELDTWDYQWVYTNLSRGRVSIIPNVNLVRNIGFDASATHTTNPNDPVARVSSGEVRLDEGPSFVLPDNEADDYTYSTHLNLELNPVVSKSRFKFLIPVKKLVKRLLKRE